MLPFGLLSAPVIFSALADTLLWVPYQRGITSTTWTTSCFFGPQGTSDWLRNREEALQICAELGVPVAAEKLGGPVPVLTFLGIELDTERQELRLPASKLRKTQREIARWLSRSSCVVRKLESLIGLLQQAATVVSAGRAFLRRLIALVALRRNHNSVVLLNQAARADLAWWATFLPAWNGRGFFATLGDACAETF